MERPLKPYPIYKELAPTPQDTPQYSVQVQRKDKSTITLGDPKATRALVALMNQHAVIGGAAAHWGGPAAFAEIMSALHGIMFSSPGKWWENFHFVNDAGHTENGIYALRANYGFDNLKFEDLRGFRSIESKLTGHGEAHLNPEGVKISNGPLGSGVPQAQGLCLADKLLNKKRTTLCTLSDGGSMEGETKEAFAAIPGLASKEKLNPFVLVISDNNTKLSGRIEADSYSMKPSFNSLEALGWELIKVEEGHNLELLLTTFENAIEKAQNNPQKPVAVVCKTVKGYGVQSTAESASGGHGYPLKPYDEKLPAFIDEIYEGQAPEFFQKWAQEILQSKPQDKDQAADGEKKEKVQVGVAKACIEAVEKDLPIFSLSADLQGSTGIAGFHKAYPERAIDVGVAEANMISTAIGLSKEGLIPVVDTFAQFGITKGNLPLIMSGLSCAPVVGLFSHIGFQDAADGASHQATTYFAATSALPQVQVVSLSCSQAAHQLLGQGLQMMAEQKQKQELPDSQLYFYGRETHPVSFNPEIEYKWGKAVVLREGQHATLVATGPMVQVAMEAAEQASAQDGVELTVIDAPFINRPDTETIASALQKTQGKLITLEDHQKIGGMGQQLVHALSLKNIPFRVQTLGVDGKFGQSAYKARQLYDLHGLGIQGVKNAVIGLE